MVPIAVRLVGAGPRRVDSHGQAGGEYSDDGGFGGTDELGSSDLAEEISVL